jgi:hypothetical protein
MQFRDVYETFNLSTREHIGSFLVPDAPIFVNSVSGPI